jgi:hypothetical protein
MEHFYEIEYRSIPLERFYNSIKSNKPIDKELVSTNYKKNVCYAYFDNFFIIKTIIIKDNSMKSILINHQNFLKEANNELRLIKIKKLNEHIK